MEGSSRNGQTDATVPSTMSGSRCQARDIVVIGGSAGALEPLRIIVERLRADLPAAIFVVQHLAAGRRSGLPGLVGRWGPLAAVEAKEGAPLRYGLIQIAPPDEHLLLESNKVRLGRGPLENRVRPAIDPLFRSAAAHHDGRVVAVLLSGYLTDGTAGLEAVQRCGGLTIVQDPKDALVDEMPSFACSHLDADYVADARQIADLLNDVIGQPVRRIAEVPLGIRMEAAMAAGEGLSIANEDRLGAPSPFACPDCSGNLWEVRDGRVLRFRCHTGHAYSGRELQQAQDEQLDRALWSALRVLRERAVMLRRMADDARERNRSMSIESFVSSARQVEEEAAVLERFILGADRRIMSHMSHSSEHASA